MAAEATVNQITGKRERVCDLLAVTKQDLNAVPCQSVDEDFVLARIPVFLVANLSDVSSVIEHVVDRGAGPIRLALAVDDSFFLELLDDTFKRAVAVGVKLKQSTDVCRFGRMSFDQPPAVDTNVLKSVRSFVGEQSFLHAAVDVLTDIDGHLFGEEARHVGERASHHATGRIVFGLL